MNSPASVASACRLFAALLLVGFLAVWWHQSRDRQADPGSTIVPAAHWEVTAAELSAALHPKAPANAEPTATHLDSTDANASGLIFVAAQEDEDPPPAAEPAPANPAPPVDPVPPADPLAPVDPVPPAAPAGESAPEAESEPMSEVPMADPLEKKIVFNFGKAPWDVALTRFAELAELQLILKFKPPGTFDYSSNKAYTIPEALDILNEVLIAEGFVVLRTDRFLTLAALDQPLPVSQIPVVKVEDLPKRGKNEFVTVVRRLEYADPEKIEPELQRLIGPYGQIQIVPSLKIIRISDQVSRLTDILPLLDEIDERAKPKNQPPPQDVPRVRKTHTLAHLSTTQATSLIKAILGISGTIEPGPDDKSLIAVLTEAEHKAVEDFLKELDTPTSRDDQPAERSFTLTSASADSVLSLLRSLYPEKETGVTAGGDEAANVVAVHGPGRIVEQIARLIEAVEEQARAKSPTQEVYRTGASAPALATQLEVAFGGRRNRDVSIAVGGDGESILVTAPADVQSRVKDALSKLNEGETGEGGDQTSVIKLEHASAEKLAATLTKIFAKSAISVSVGSDEATNSLVLRAPASRLESIAKIVKDLDLPPTVTGLREKEEQIFEPQHARAADLVKIVESLYPTSTNVIFVPAAGNKVVVSAPSVLMGKVKGTLELLDKAAEAAADSLDRAYTLRHATPAEVITTLTTLFPAAEHDLRFIADAPNNRILVVGSDEKLHARVAEMINQLDVPSAGEHVIEIYTAQSAPAGSLVESLTKVFGAESSKPTFSVQRDGKSILIRAPRMLQTRISELLAKVDVPPGDESAVPVDEIYKLKFAKAVELVTALEKIYPPAQSQVTITAEPANNILVISAPPEIQERIKGLLEKIDVPSDARMKLEIYAPEQVSPATISTLIASMKYDGLGTMVTSADGRLLLVLASEATHERIKRLVDTIAAQEAAADLIRKTYPLENVTASALLSMLQPLFPASGPQPATMVADPTGKQLIVQAPEKTQAAIAEIIRQADIPSPLVDFTIAAKHVTVSSLYTQVSGLFSGVDGTRVTYDVGSGTVGVVATPAMKERILALAEKFDQPIDPASGRIRVIYKVKNSLAVYVYTALSALFPPTETGVSMTYDAYNNLVVATATAPQQERIKEEFERLDTSPRADWITKTFRPEHVGATELSTFLTTQLASVTDKSISVGAHESDVVVSAKPSVMEEVEKLFKAYDVAAPAEGNRVRRVYRPTFANPGYLQNNLQAAFPKSRRVDVTYDPYSATVTVLAPAELQEEIARLVSELDRNPRGDWVEKSFEPKHLTVDQLSQFLTTALAQETNRTIAPSPGGERVVAIAPPAVMERIERLVETMDKPRSEGGESKLKVYSLKYASAGSVYTLIAQLFPTSTTGVKFYYDPTTSSVSVVAPPSVHAQIETLVQSMDVDPNAQREQRVFIPKHAPAPQLVTLLQTALASERSVSVALGPQKGSVVVFAPAESMPRIEQYIHTLDTEEGADRTRQLYKLTHGSANYLVGTLQALYPPAQFPVAVTADGGNNVLVVEAPAVFQEKIAAIVKELDVPPGGRTQVVYRLEHTRASSVLSSLTNLLSGTSSNVVPGPDDRSVVVNALPSQHEQVAGFLRDFDTADNSQDPKSKVYQLRLATASNVARMIQQLFNNERDVRVTYDDVLNAVYVTAPPRLLSQIEQLVNDSDKEGVEANLVSEVLRIREASANDIARALSTAFPDRKKASFVADGGAGTIFVRAMPTILPEIKQMVEQMDQPREVGTREIAVFELFEIDPFDAQAIADELFKDQSSSERPQIETTFEPPRLIVRATPSQMTEIRQVLAKLEGGRLKDVGGEPGANGMPDEPGVSEKPIERVIRLNDADAIATMRAIEHAWALLRRNPLTIVKRQSPLDALVDPMVEAEPPTVPLVPREDLPGDPKVPVTVIVGNDRLTASSRDLDALELLDSLAQAWTEPFDPDKSASRVFYLEHGDVQEIAAAINEAFNGKDRQDSDRRRFRPERVRVVAEANANALIVRANPVDLVNVKDLIDQLDVLPETEKKPRIIPLKQADADEVVAVIREVFADYLAAGSGPPINVPGVRGNKARSRSSAMSVDVDPRSNSIVISAPESIIADVEKLIEGLETAATDSQKSYRVIPIQNASPADVRSALEMLLDRQLRSSPSGTRPTKNRRPTTPRPRRPKATSSIDVQPLPSGKEAPTETQVATIRRGGPSEEKFDANVQAVAADEEDLDESHLMAAALEVAENTPLEEGQLGAMSGTVDISILEDVGALLLLGSDKDLQTLGEIVAEIERINKIRELGFEIFPLAHAKAASMADLLNDVYGRLQDARGVATRPQAQATVLPLAKPNALLLVAPKDELAGLVELARSFDVAVTAETEFQLFRLKHVRATVLAQTIESFYASRSQEGNLAPEVVIESDDRSNSLLVYAAPRDMEEVARLVTELDTSKTARVNELRIFYLKHTVSTELASTLQATLQTGQPGSTGGGPGGAAAARGVPGLQIADPDDPKQAIGSGILEGVTITPNRRANALIVAAPKDVMALIESLITRLDVLPEAIAEIKVFTLVNSDAATMVQTLRSLFAQLQSDQNRVAVTPTPLGTSETSPLVELSFSIDERTNSILVSGSREQLEVVEAIILRLDGSDIEERKSEVYRLKNAPAQDVATSLTELLAQQQQLQGVQEGQSLQQQLEQEVIVVPEPISNSLLISASPRFYDRVISLIEKLDELPPQVVIQVLLVEVELDADAELGVELGLQDGLLFQRSNQNANAQNLTGTYFNDGSTPGFNFNSGGPLGDNIYAARPDKVAGQGLSNFALGRTNSALGYGGLILSASSESVSILLRALARERRLEVLSRPQIMTLDNQQASIVVGAEVPRITGSNLVQGAGVTQSIEYVPSGIILEVTPKINPDGTVVMTVSPEISRLSPANDPDLSVQIAPGVVARSLLITRALTTVSTMNGQTVVIGGLIRKSVEREERKVPCLGDIPVAGHLFRYDRLTKRRSELLIILTPHVVRNQAEADQIKATEAARMNWCLSGVEKLHGDLGLPTEVYLGESPFEAPFETTEGEMIIDEQVIPEGENIEPVPGESMNGTMEEMTVPSETGETAPESIEELPKRQFPSFHQTKKQTKASSTQELAKKEAASPADKSASQAEKSLTPEQERARARAERAKKDEELFQSPWENRRQEFKSWKERNLRWKRSDAQEPAESADSAEPKR